MLSIGKITSGPVAARYYLDQVGHGREDYYAGEREAAGEWVGSGAASLGWSGEVDSDDFVSLLAGADVRPIRANGVAGFDLTFRAPKSVSVLWGVAPDWVAGELRAAHVAAVGEALAYLEREACRARRGTDGVISVNGRGFVGAAFVHRSSRAGDPLLHSHVVVGNLTQGPDGRWTALDARHLYRHAKAAGFLYQAALRDHITERLGLEWSPVEHGVADVSGVPRAVVEHFSRRRAQIVEHMAERGVSSPAAAQVAALETRRSKQHVAADRLRAEWRARAAEHGLTADTVDHLIRGRSTLRLPTVTGELLSELTSQTSSFGRPDLLQALAAAHPDGAPVHKLEALADRILADRAIVQLVDGRAQAGVTEARYTTRELLRIEEALVLSARRRRIGALPVSRSVIDELLRGSPLLTAQQRQVVEGLCGRADGVVVVRAAAGTGKTFALETAREAWQASGSQVLGCALSARAALELESQAGIPSRTIASVLRSLESGDELPRRSVLVVDEAGMVGTRDLARLAQAAERAQAKLVLVGDDRQLPEIAAGGAFRALAERLDALELHEVLRQREAWDRAALGALRNGETERWARAYLTRGRITISETADDARASLVDDWSRAAGDAVMIAARRADVTDLNQRARQKLKSTGRLPEDRLSVGRRDYSIGDRVVATRNDRTRGILNGQRGTVALIDSAAQTITVALDTGPNVVLDQQYLKPGLLHHAYALTAHRAQGATVDQAFVLAGERVDREWAYTALSRHCEQARLYVTRSDLQTDLPASSAVVHGLARLVTPAGPSTWRSRRCPRIRCGLGAGTAPGRPAWGSSADGRSATARLRRGEAHSRSRCASTTDRRARS